MPFPPEKDLCQAARQLHSRCKITVPHIPNRAKQITKEGSFFFRKRRLGGEEGCLFYSVLFGSVLFGSVWFGLVGCQWVRVGAIGNEWERLGTSGCHWERVGANGNEWERVGYSKTAARCVLTGSGCPVKMGAHTKIRRHPGMRRHPMDANQTKSNQNKPNRIKT